MAEARYAAGDLVEFASALFAAAGTPAERARVIGELLVEADLMGHTTHGLALAGAYLGEIEKGQMEVQGEPQVVRDKGACLTWDGRRLSGVWLTASAVDEAVARSERFGIGSVVVRNGPPYCVPRHLPHAGNGQGPDGDRDQLRSLGRQRGAVRGAPRRCSRPIPSPSASRPPAIRS